MPDITAIDLVRNGTMAAEMAAVLWAAVDEEQSFLTVAIPRFAGKTTTSNAVLAMRRPETPAVIIAGEPHVVERLKAERRGGYIVVAEFDNAPVPGYIWGAPVRRVFECAVEGGYALQASLHADSAVNGLLEVTLGNQVPDSYATLFKYVIYIERFGTSPAHFWRRITDLYELHDVQNGRPIGHSLFSWNSSADAFDMLNEPSHLSASSTELEARADVIQELADSGRTGAADMQAAFARYRDTRA